jgi:quercetin dioxygenase-like cupin family protein
MATGRELRITPTESVTVKKSGPDLLEVEGAWAPGGKPPPKHLHPSQDEHFKILEGRMRVRVDGEDQTLEEGDEIDIPSGAVHQMWNEDEEPARALWQTRPSLRTEQWFEAIDRLYREDRVGRNGEPGPLAFAALLTEFDDCFRLAVGPQPVVRGALGALAPLGRARGYLRE